MFNTIARIIRWTGNKRRRVYAGFVLSFFQSITIALPIMAATWALGLAINRDDPRGDAVRVCAGAIAVAVLARFLISWARARVQESIGYEVCADERLKTGDILKRVSLGFYDKRNTGEIAGAVTTDFSFVELYSMKMIDVVVNGYIGVTAMILCMIPFSPPLAGIATAGVALSLACLLLLNAQSARTGTEHQAAQDDMLEATIEYLRGMPVVKSFKQAGVARSGIAAAFERSKRVNIRIEREFWNLAGLHVAALRLAGLGIMGASAMLCLSGRMEPNVMIMMIIFSFVMFGHVEAIKDASHVIAVIGKTFDKLDAIREAPFIDEHSEDGRPIDHSIRFDDVCFAYEERTVLDHVSFTVPEGSTTAIVGPSGSGKTTICNLIARFWDPLSGAVRIGGLDARSMTCDNLLSNMSMVFQRVYLFNDSIANNIAFGKPGASRDDIMDAARRACCHDFIERLPLGYDTVIGEGGSSLSGGERQRISIARALLKDAPIVLLDEATASVDPENESQIQAALAELTHGKTIVIIAHRLSTIERADQIIVVDGGRIVERGTHDELSLNEGLYARFLAMRSRAESWELAS